MAKIKVTMDIKGMDKGIRPNMSLILELAAVEARNEWVKLAREVLHSTASAYVSAIGEPEGRGLTRTIRLKSDTSAGKLANALEEGIGPFDMKEGFLKSRKAKRSKAGGKYITIPFQLKTPGAAGGMPPVMPRSIYRLASQMQSGQQLKLPTHLDGYAIRSRLSPDLKKWDNYTWKSSPFQGITKTPMFPGMLPEAQKSSKYTTFRRVSSKSDPSSWIHPGFRAVNLADRASEKLKDIFPKIVETVWDGGL
jgi:hypothetical protein